MPNYDFKPLSSYDFECLSRDLLQKELQITLESFKSGRDKGIDFRYAPSSGKKIIVQAKHYAESPYPVLLSKLSNEELPKVRHIKPSRYIIVTSIGLTPPNKDEIMQLFQPYCQSTSDIYGRNDLNNLLSKYPDVEKQNFKLWLTSQTVLDKILHSKIYTQSESEIDYIKKRLCYYVQNESFFAARKILDEHGYCIVAGIPGIGKTTLAEVLLIFYLDKGYKIFKVSNDISEALEVFDSHEKQVFYYDDFLGQIHLGDKLNKNEDERILKFIDSVKRSKDSKFVLTTREYILNQAKENYEKLENSKFDIHKCVIDLSSYTKYNRAKILFNHVYFSKIDPAFITSLLHKKSYNLIINHRNFNPRIIEWMTDKLETLSIDAKNYTYEFLKKLDNPVDIWNFAFDKHISVASQHLLLTLYSMPGEVFLEDLEAAFTNYYEYQSKQCRFSIYANDFRTALKELDGNFIKIEGSESQKRISFHNPSIRDFLGNYLLKNPKFVKALFETITYYEQCINLCGYSPQNNTFSPIIETLKKFTDILWLAIKNNFESIDCGIAMTWASGTIQRCRRAITLEMRLKFALDIADIIESRETLNIIDLMVSRLIKNYEENTGSSWWLIEILSKLAKNNFKHIGSKNALLNAAKNYIIGNMKSLDDYDYIVQFEELFPELFSANESGKIRFDFEDFYKGDVKYVMDSDDQSTVVQYKDDLKSISRRLNIDASDTISDLETRISEIETREPDMDEDYLREHDDTEHTDDEIDSIFDSLKG